MRYYLGTSNINYIAPWVHGADTLDDAYIGGKQKGERGRGAKGKTPFVSAFSLNEEGHPIYMRLSDVPCFKKQEITDWAKST